jgi:hypothetical protein
LEAVTHRRRELLPLEKDNVLAMLSLVIFSRERWVTRTLSHKVLEMVPFDVVGEVADVDPAVLLRRLLDAAHHLFPVHLAILK